MPTRKQMNRKTRYAARGSGKKNKTIKVIIGIIVGVVVLAAVGFLIFYLVMRGRQIKSETEFEESKNEGAMSNYTGIAGKAPEDLSDDWWKNPTNVAVYTADWCSKGHEYELTSKGCRIAQDNPGENKVSESDWDKIINDRAKTSGMGMSTSDISAACAAVARRTVEEYAVEGNAGLVYRSCKNLSGKYRCNPSTASSATLNSKIQGNIEAYMADKFTKYKSWNATQDYFDRCMNSSEISLAPFSGVLAEASAHKDAWKRLTKAVWKKMWLEAKVEASLARFAKYLKETTTPDQLGYVIVYTSGSEAEACQNRKKAATDACVANVQRLLESGTVQTLTELNAKMAGMSDSQEEV